MPPESLCLHVQSRLSMYKADFPCTNPGGMPQESMCLHVQSRFSMYKAGRDATGVNVPPCTKPILHVQSRAGCHRIRNQCASRTDLTGSPKLDTRQLFICRLRVVGFIPTPGMQENCDLVCQFCLSISNVHACPDIFAIGKSYKILSWKFRALPSKRVGQTARST
jgi:hypothetical protein